MEQSSSSLEAYYDQYGSEQESQAYYEDPAFDWLIARGAIGDGVPVSLAEFGCGTGRFARRVVQAQDGAEFAYRGFDVSGTMVDLTREALAPQVADLDVRKTGGQALVPLADSSVSHFACTFVLDLLPDEQQQTLLHEANRVLQPGGFALLASLDSEARGFAKLTGVLWKVVYTLVPMRVGGCRPVALLGMVDRSPLTFAEAHAFSVRGLGVRCVVARKNA